MIRIGRAQTRHNSGRRQELRRIIRCSGF